MRRPLFPIVFFAALTGCTHPTPLQAYADMNAGDLPRFESDPHLAALRARYDQDRSAVLADPVSHFKVPTRSTCELEQAAVYRLFDLDQLEVGARKAGATVEVKIDGLRFAATRGTCADGSLSGDVAVRAAWNQTFIMPDLDAVTSETWIEIREGTLVDGSFIGPLKITRWKSKQKMELDVGEDEMITVKTPVGLDGQLFVLSYGDYATYFPTELKSASMTIVFDAKDLTRMMNVTEPVGAGLLKSTTWMGSKMKSSQVARPDGTLHGWQEIYAHRVAGFDVPGTKTCWVEGEQVKKDVCP